MYLFLVNVLFSSSATEKIITDPEDEPSTQNIGAIVGGIVAAVFVAVVVAVVVVLFLRRRKDPERRKLDDRKELGSDQLTGETSALGVVGEFEEQDVVSKDVYAVVNKPKMSTAETSADQPETATYGVVNKNKPSSKPPTSGDSGANTCPPASKSKPKKEKGTKRKAVNKERTEHEYGNITLSMAPAGSSVVDTGKKAEKETKKSAGGAAVRQANQDGLLYTMVDFSGQRQQSTKPAPPPDQQGVVYSDVLFNQSVTKQ
ncbi:hypothetical protein BaRGS_00023248 [Batillaria attramentaria]|uniref:Uncharacterized protein n=1 Tax=Batillaria attramentaria TaxID=370345 RepID=A0ABD0KET3_9CAEN